jgi:hypothetical protein
VRAWVDTLNSDSQRWKRPLSRRNESQTGEDFIGIFMVAACLPPWCWRTYDVRQRTDTLVNRAYLQIVVYPIHPATSLAGHRKMVQTQPNPLGLLLVRRLVLRVLLRMVFLPSGGENATQKLDSLEYMIIHHIKTQELSRLEKMFGLTTKTGFLVPAWLHLLQRTASDLGPDDFQHTRPELISHGIDLSAGDSAVSKAGLGSGKTYDAAKRV